MTGADTLSHLLRTLAEQALPGVNLLELESNAAMIIGLMGATSCNKNYQPEWAKSPFPSILCLAVNDEISHAPARDQILNDGDLLTIDCGIKVDNLCFDAALTVGIGEVSARDERLLRYSKKTLEMGISIIKPGVKVTEVGRTIENYAKQNGFVTNKRLNGHAIGEAMHLEPVIPMYNIGLERVPSFVDKRGRQQYVYRDYQNIPVFVEGQMYCIEPHLSYKDEYGILGSDGWTVKTRDGRKASMFESMVKVTSTGVEILTTHI